MLFRPALNITALDSTRQVLSRCPLRAQGVCSLCRHGGSCVPNGEKFPTPPLSAPATPILQPVWVDEKYVSQEVVEDFEAGLEYAQAEAVLGCRQQGTMRKYLVR